MPIADKLQITLSTKNAIKDALVAKGVEVGSAPFSEYPTLIDDMSAGFPVGTVADWKLDQNDAKWLVCDGGSVSETEWPELFDVLGTTFNDGSEPTGYFRLPDHPEITLGDTRVQPLIKAES